MPWPKQKNAFLFIRFEVKILVTIHLRVAYFGNYNKIVGVTKISYK
jgi:hypothetical protein